MENNLTTADYLERAEMHDRLAEATADTEARKMHRAMAAEYRNRASAADNGIQFGRTDHLLEVAVPMGPVA